jgi:hypothetical protein
VNWERADTSRPGTASPSWPGSGRVIDAGVLAPGRGHYHWDTTHVVVGSGREDLEGDHRKNITAISR